MAACLALNQTLTTLTLDENGVGAEVHFRDPHESAGIGDAGGVALAAGLAANSSLRALSLRANEIGDAGASAFAESLKNAALTKLDLRDNHISESARTRLLAAAVNPGIEVLV